MLFLKSRSLQPILSQPVEEVLTYEALRYVHLYANTHTHTHTHTHTLKISILTGVTIPLFFRWAWCSVNTRSVFMSHPSNNFLSGQDVYALAPFLDLLNHRPDVQVNCRCDVLTDFTVTSFQKSQQKICYFFFLGKSEF